MGPVAAADEHGIWLRGGDGNMEGGEKGAAARRRPKAAREAYSLYVERAGEGGSEAE